MSVDLRDIAISLLREHKTLAAAGDALATKITKDADLRHAVALAILRPFVKRERPATQSRHRPGPHRRPQAVKAPTKQQRIGALEAERVYAAGIFDRKLRGGTKLGDVRMHELRSIAEASASTATSFLQRGYEDAVETFACVMLSKHCVSPDPFAKVRDVIKPATAANIFEQARIKAAEALRDSSGRLAQELIATAQQQELSQ